MDFPVCRIDDDLLQKLFVAVRSELNLDFKNIKTEQVKFWKQHPSIVKVLCHAGTWQYIIVIPSDHMFIIQTYIHYFCTPLFALFCALM